MNRDPRRLFSPAERAHIAARQQQACSVCEQDLPESFHVHHITPWADGGRTHPDNGIAICPECHIKAPTKPLPQFEPYPWQSEALPVVLANLRGGEFATLNAAPGAGKTLFTGWVYRNLVVTGDRARLVVFVPNANLRSQHADELASVGIHLDTSSATERRDRDGVVLTYHVLSDPVAVQQTVEDADTTPTLGVHCFAEHELGTRTHPVTGAFCEYFRCRYLAGTVENRDVVENASVLWVNRDQVTSFVPAHLIFPPILDTLTGQENAVPPPDTPHDDSQPAIAAAVIATDDRVLLVRRRIAEGPLSWSFPSGSQEPSESAPQAAVREAREEVGLDVIAQRVIGERTHPATGRHMIYVACRATSGEAHLADTDELAELAWCRLDELDEYVPHGLFQPVEDHLRQSLATS